MLNLQLAEKPVWRDDGALDIVSIFETIQGEGPFAGVPSVFIRTAGCSLACSLCDTQYTQGRFLITPQELLSRVQALRPGGLVVITGGEPLRQRLTPCLEALLAAGYQVQIETNGLHYDDEVPWGKVTAVCSPKAPSVSARLEPHIACYKYVVEAGHIDPDDGLPLQVLGDPCRAARPRAGYPSALVYVQPCDDQDLIKNQANAQAAIQSCLKFGYRLCVQIHKMMGLP